MLLEHTTYLLEVKACDYVIFKNRVYYKDLILGNISNIIVSRTLFMIDSIFSLYLPRVGVNFNATFNAKHATHYNNSIMIKMTYIKLQIRMGTLNISP